MNREKTVALVGFMGAGKSTVARCLAAKLGRPCVDLDERVEVRTGRHPASWIRESGEAAFRRVEAEALDEVLDGAAGGRPPVLACGGGVLEGDRTRSRLMAEAICVWLDIPFDLVVERAGGDRPLLDAPMAAVRELYAARRRLYAAAPLRVGIAGKSAEEVAVEVADLLAASGAAEDPGP